MPIAQVDDDVVRRAQRGDPEAFAAIVHAYRLPIFTYVLRLVSDRGLAEDVTQEVFLRAYQSLPRFSFRSALSTWLFQIAKNRVVDELRARERRPRQAELATDGDDAPHVVDPPAERSETIDALWRAVAGLSFDLKSALLLRDVAGFSYNEIAEILGTTLATVKWRIYRARQEVQAALEALEARETPRALAG